MAFKDVLGKIGDWAGKNSNPLIALGGTILSNLTNNKAQKNSADRQMDFQRESYNIQRNDVLADRDHEEAYNSPIQQAQRLRQAGMSPMDYMSDPVATSTGDSGSAGDGAMPDLIGAMSGIGEIGGLFEQKRQFDEQMKEQKRLNNAQIAKTKAETIKTEADNYREGVKLKTDLEKFDMEKTKFMDEVRSLKLSNHQQDQIIKHNDVMFPLIEKAQDIETQLKDETKELVKSQLRANVNLDEQRAKNLAQEYVTNGPQAFLSKLTEEFYGEHTDGLLKQIQSETDCSITEAMTAVVEAGIEQGVLSGAYGEGVRSLGIYKRIGEGILDQKGNSGASRGLLGSIVRALATK